MNNYKFFVEVTAKYDIQGIRPLFIKWEMGESSKLIVSLIDVRQASSLKTGGMGIWYTCKFM